MPRKYKRQPGARRYCDYSEERLKACLDAIENGGITQRAAEKIYGIPRRTIINKLKSAKGIDKPRKPGYQPIFTEEEEASFEKCINSFCEFGFPLSTFDLRMIVKTYLEKTGRLIKRFKNNIPGNEWVLSFLKRHPKLNGSRLASNIKRSRAAVDEQTITSYITNLSSVLEGVPSKNIWNYDETNLTDDPGKKKVIVKRGLKYPERIFNSSKTSISLMMCGSADGELLPPYVVYRSGKMWDLWCENGPKGVRYNNTSSGWFDAQVFTDWFQSLLLPRLKKLNGKKVVIGDNLSSHLTEDVLKMCEENNIAFVCLPPNSTHLTQPLDVAFFAPMKKAWRAILTNWKETEGFNHSNLQKQHFPRLLNRLMTALEPNSKSNLISGFRTCGIYPVSAEELLKKLPKTKSEEKEIEDSFLDQLQEKRRQWTENKGQGRKRKAVSVPAGNSIGADDLHSLENIDLSAPSTSGLGKCSEAKNQKTLSKKKKNQINKPYTVFKKTSRSELRDYEEEYNSDFTQEIEEYELDKKCDETLVSLAEGKQNFKDLLEVKEVVKREGEHVVFSYEGEIFPGKIISFNNNEVCISSMQKSMRSWKWPNPEDKHNYPWEDILGGISPPKQISKRGFYEVPELDKIWF